MCNRQVEVHNRQIKVYNRQFEVYNRQFEVYNRQIKVYNRQFEVSKLKKIVALIRFRTQKVSRVCFVKIFAANILFSSSALFSRK